MSPHWDRDHQDPERSSCVTLWLTMMYRHTTSGYKRCSTSEDIVLSNIQWHYNFDLQHDFFLIASDQQSRRHSLKNKIKIVLVYKPCDLDLEQINILFCTPGSTILRFCLENVERFRFIFTLTHRTTSGTLRKYRSRSLWKKASQVLLYSIQRKTYVSRMNNKQQKDKIHMYKIFTVWVSEMRYWSQGYASTPSFIKTNSYLEGACMISWGLITLRIEEMEIK